MQLQHQFGTEERAKNANCLFRNKSYKEHCKAVLEDFKSIQLKFKVLNLFSEVPFGLGPCYLKHLLRFESPSSTFYKWRVSSLRKT